MEIFRERTTVLNFFRSRYRFYTGEQSAQIFAYNARMQGENVRAGRTRRGTPES